MVESNEDDLSASFWAWLSAVAAGRVGLASDPAADFVADLTVAEVVAALVVDVLEIQDEGVALLVGDVVVVETTALFVIVGMAVTPASTPSAVGIAPGGSYIPNLKSTTPQLFQ